jgi:hypothetical protein
MESVCRKWVLKSLFDSLDVAGSSEILRHKAESTSDIFLRMSLGENMLAAQDELLPDFAKSKVGVKSHTKPATVIGSLLMA